MSKRTRGQLLAGGGAILALVAALAAFGSSRVPVPPNSSAPSSPA